MTDHRIGFNGTYNGVLLGDGLGDVITALQAADRAQKLEAAVWGFSVLRTANLPPTLRGGLAFYKTCNIFVAGFIDYIHFSLFTYYTIRITHKEAV